MRLGIDAYPLLLRSAGVKNYLFHWIDHLLRAPGGHRIEAFPWLTKRGPLVHDGSTLSPWATHPRIALLFFLNLPGNPATDWLTSRFDVFHLTNQIRRLPRHARATATLHDLTCWIMPEVHTTGNIEADRRFAKAVVTRAHRLIAVSENTRQDAIRILHIDPERIETIHSGVPSAYFDAAPAPAAKPYVLFVGTIEPRKNIETLLDAWMALKPSLRQEYDLLLAGPTGWRSESTMARLAGGLPGVRHAGYVPEKDLPGLTAGATVFAYPSFYEGFGFPVAQAMAARVPVLTSSTSCLPEIAGEGALFADPRSVSGIASALDRMLTSPSLREDLARKGRSRAEHYRWERCASESIQFFERAAG
ncbi:MAG TPA: glycosyltransferase family 1 protein [Bryobacteraceae bacterium]|jgi:alpha-1,3-rhamnosyl/mannosyltransferase|nr:glycosyltransferase family 1 protein [Bryobacteraceae bacterium]